MTMFRLTAATACMTVALLVPPADAQPCGDLTVPTGCPTIQDAIDSASHGDVILVAAGEYHEAIDLQGKSITIRSEHGPSVTIIVGPGDGPAVRCVSGEAAQTILSGFTVTGPGQGLRIEDSAPVVESCWFLECEDARGGGVSIDGGQPVFLDCRFEHNDGGQGGGAYALGAAPIFSGCMFFANIASGLGDVARGGGLALEDSHATLVDCTFFGNLSDDRCTGRGGALDVRGGSVVVIDGLLSDNRASGGGSCGGQGFAYGGAISNQGGIVTIVGSAVRNNIAGLGSKDGVARGGGVFSSEGSLSVNNSSFCDNIVAEYDTHVIHIHGVWTGSGNEFVDVCDGGIPGDVDGDGTVGFADLLAVLGQWGPWCFSCSADLDGDNDVGLTDLLIVLSNWTVA